jgi:hypothetical protein
LARSQSLGSRLFYAPKSRAQSKICAFGRNLYGNRKKGLEKSQVTETTSSPPLAENLPLFMTAAEISERIKKINARTLKRAQARGDIKGYLHGGKWVFEVPTVLAWISGKKKTFAPEPVTPTGSIPSGKRPRGRPRKAGQKEASI